MEFNECSYQVLSNSTVVFFSLKNSESNKAIEDKRYFPSLGPDSAETFGRRDKSMF